MLGTQVKENGKKQEVFKCQIDITGYICFQAISIVECAMFYLIFFFSLTFYLCQSLVQAPRGHP